MSKEELVKDILFNYSKKDIVFIKKSLSDSLKKEKIIINVYNWSGEKIENDYTFYDIKEANEFFDNLMKNAIRKKHLCVIEAYGQGWRRSLHIRNGIENDGILFQIDHSYQCWICMTLKKIKKSKDDLEQMEKNKHLFLDDEGKFLSWVKQSSLL